MLVVSTPPDEGGMASNRKRDKTTKGPKALGKPVRPNAPSPKASPPELPKALGKPVNDAGLKARNVRASAVRWMVDQDYAHTLPPAERLWLANFNDAIYSGDFRNWSQDDFPQETRREIWADLKGATRQDAHAIAANAELVSSLDDPETRIAWLEARGGSMAQGPGPGVSVREWLEGDEDADAPPADLSPTPDYLNSPEYKAARDAFRQTLHPGRREIAPKDTPAHRRATRRLYTLIPYDVEEP